MFEEIAEIWKNQKTMCQTLHQPAAAALAWLQHALASSSVFWLSRCMTVDYLKLLIPVLALDTPWKQHLVPYLTTKQKVEHSAGKIS